MLCEPTKASCPHPHPAAGFLVDQRHRGAEARRRRGSAHRRAARCPTLIAVDDFQVARQQPFEQLDRPGLQRFRQQRVVGVGQRRHRDLPGLVPAEIVQIDQDPHQLGDGEARMGVVEPAVVSGSAASSSRRHGAGAAAGTVSAADDGGSTRSSVQPAGTRRRSPSIGCGADTVAVFAAASTSTSTASRAAHHAPNSDMVPNHARSFHAVTKPFSKSSLPATSFGWIKITNRPP